MDNMWIPLVLVPVLVGLLVFSHYRNKRRFGSDKVLDKLGIAERLQNLDGFEGYLCPGIQHDQQIPGDLEYQLSELEVHVTRWQISYDHVHQHLRDICCQPDLLQYIDPQWQVKFMEVLQEMGDHTKFIGVDDSELWFRHYHDTAAEVCKLLQQYGAVIYKMHHDVEKHNTVFEFRIEGEDIALLEQSLNEKMRGRYIMGFPTGPTRTLTVKWRGGVR